MEPGIIYSDGYKLKKHSREISRNIPDDVLFEEILVRLPVKSLTVYKSVCKTWLNKIESGTFREAHRRRHISYNSDHILVSPFKRTNDPTKHSFSLLPSMRSFGPGMIKMISRPLDVMLPPEMTQLEFHKVGHWKASINVLGPIRTTGIYCIVASMRWGPRTPYPFLQRAKISICNPATREYKLTNPFPLDETARLSNIIYRDCCRLHYGFGLVANNDYKVVVVMNSMPSYCVFLSYVYSLKQGAWKKIVDSEAAMVSRLDLRGKPHFPEIEYQSGELCPQVFLNGCWHWTAHFSDETCNILSFDGENEVFKLVLGPPSYKTNKQIEYECSGKTTSDVVSSLNGHLAMLTICMNRLCIAGVRSVCG